MLTTWRKEIPQFVLILGMIAAAVVLWPWAPEKIPVHWNIAGQVDRYGGKLEGLLLMPLLAVGIYFLLLLLPRIDPRRANYVVFAGSYWLIRMSITTLMAFIYGCILFAAFGYQIDMGLFISVAVGLLLCVLGNVMGKIRPNWFVGVRTPWTLSSRESWNKTHRLAGRLLVLMGLLTAALGFWQSPLMLAIVVGAGVATVLTVVVYSYIMWRDDPDRIRPAGTAPSE